MKLSGFREFVPRTITTFIPTEDFDSVFSSIHNDKQITLRGY